MAEPHHGAPGPADPAPSERTLVVIHDGNRHPVDLAPLFFGRDPRNHVQLVSARASRFHAAVYRAGDNHVLRDLHSRNGVTLNGRPVSVAQLRPGDVIAFEDEEARVEAGVGAISAYRETGVVVAVDIKRYAALTEHYGDEIVQHLRDVLARLEDHALQEQGCPVRNVGGGIVVVFGLWPVADRRHSAADAALAFARHAVTFIPKEVQEFLAGEESCDVHVGMAGGRFRVDVDRGLDVSGETVNLAVRLQLVNRIYGTRLAMSQVTVEQLRERGHLRELDTVRLKGLTEPITIFAFDERSRVRQEATTLVTSLQAVEGPLEYLRLYAKGLELYRQGEFAPAFETLDQCVAHYRDAPARALRERIVMLMERKKEGRLDTWDGVWTLDTR